MILWVESASQLRLDGQERKIIWCNKNKSDSRRLRRPGQIIFVEPRRGNVLKNSGLLKVPPFRLRNSDIVCAQTCRSAWMLTNCSGCAYGRGRNKVASTTLKIAVVAPMPNAIVKMAMTVTPEDLRNIRRP